MKKELKLKRFRAIRLRRRKGIKAIKILIHAKHYLLKNYWKPYVYGEAPEYYNSKPGSKEMHEAYWIIQRLVNDLSIKEVHATTTLAEEKVIEVIAALDKGGA